MPAGPGHRASCYRLLPGQFLARGEVPQHQPVAALGVDVHQLTANRIDTVRCLRQCSECIDVRQWLWDTIVQTRRPAQGPACGCDVTAALDPRQPTVIHHQIRLEDTELVSSGNRGSWAHFVPRPNLSAAARALLDLVP